MLSNIKIPNWLDVATLIIGLGLSCYIALFHQIWISTKYEPLGYTLAVSPLGVGLMIIFFIQALNKWRNQYLVPERTIADLNQQLQATLEANHNNLTGLQSKYQKEYQKLQKTQQERLDEYNKLLHMRSTQKGNHKVLLEAVNDIISKETYTLQNLLVSKILHSSKTMDDWQKKLDKQLRVLRQQINQFSELQKNNDSNKNTNEKLNQSIEQLLIFVKDNQYEMRELKSKLLAVDNKKNIDSEQLQNMASKYQAIVNTLKGNPAAIIPTFKNIFKDDLQITANLNAIEGNQMIAKILTTTSNTSERIKKILTFADSQTSDKNLLKRWQSIEKGYNYYQEIRKFIVKNKKQRIIQTLNRCKQALAKGELYQGIEHAMSLFIDTPKQSERLNLTLQNGQLIETQTTMIQSILTKDYGTDKRKAFLNTTHGLLNCLTQLSQTNDWKFNDFNKFKNDLIKIITSNIIYTKIAQQSKRLYNALPKNADPTQARRKISSSKLEANGLDYEVSNTMQGFDAMEVLKDYDNINNMKASRFKYLIALYHDTIQYRTQQPLTPLEP